jgi:3-deoxy-D-manno-octulosonic acid kinase
MSNKRLSEQEATFKDYQQGNCFGEYNSQVFDEFSPQMLCDSYWQSRDLVTGTAQGRGTTWFLKYPHKEHTHQWVLRHYYRGGLIGKLIKDHYIFTHKNKTRAACEFELLKKMQSLNLPAPKPVAYRIIKNGLVYQADLLSSRIENAKDLVGLLEVSDQHCALQSPISDESWKKIGVTIKRFHDYGIYHHDLNAHNILLDKDGAVYLIDFDRGEFRNPASLEWQESNMDRLKRSFLKEQNRLEHFAWELKHWDLLIQGYKTSTKG